MNLQHRITTPLPENQPTRVDTRVNSLARVAFMRQVGSLARGIHALTRDSLFWHVRCTRQAIFVASFSST